MSLGKTFASNESAKPLVINLIKVNLVDKKKKKLKIAPKKQTLLLKRIQKLEKENKPSEESAAAALNLSPRPTAEVSLSMKIKKNLALPSSIRGAGILHKRTDSEKKVEDLKEGASQGDVSTHKINLPNSCGQQGLDFQTNESFGGLVEMRNSKESRLNLPA